MMGINLITQKAKYLIMVIVLLLSNTNTYCKDGSFNISGKFSNQVKIPDSIMIAIYPENNTWGVLEKYYAKVNNGSFNLTIPKLTKPTKFILGARFSKKSKTIGEYFAEPNDRISVNIENVANNDTIIFTGQKAAKYNLVNRLVYQNGTLRIAIDSIYRKYISPNKKLMDSDSIILTQYFSSLRNTIDLWTKKRQEIIKSQFSIDKPIADLLVSEFGNYDGMWITIMDSSYNRYGDYPLLREIIKENFNSYFYNSKLSDSSFVLSPNYFVDLAFMLKTKLLVNGKSPKVEIVPYYDSIKENSKGIIRQRLITEFFISNFTMQKIKGFSPSVYDSLVLDASKYITKPYYAELISDKIKTKKGSKLIDANFIDLNNNSFNIKSLNGKAVLIVMWVSGCGACLSFHNTFMNKIYPSIDNLQDFVVLSINMDKTKERWLEGINSEKYTAKKFINVSTGNGQQSEFFNYYTNALPLVILIDKKGLVVTRIRGAEDSSDLIKLINSEINK